MSTVTARVLDLGRHLRASVSLVSRIRKSYPGPIQSRVVTFEDVNVDRKQTNGGLFLEMSREAPAFLHSRFGAICTGVPYDACHRAAMQVIQNEYELQVHSVAIDRLNPWIGTRYKSGPVYCMIPQGDSLVRAQYAAPSDYLSQKEFMQAWESVFGSN